MNEEYLIELFRPAGAGVNQAATSCRATHKRTGISAVSGSHRSVHMNTVTAMVECQRLVEEADEKLDKKVVEVEYLVQSLNQDTWEDLKGERDAAAAIVAKGRFAYMYGPDSLRAIRRTKTTTITEEILD